MHKSKVFKRIFLINIFMNLEKVGKVLKYVFGIMTVASAVSGDFKTAGTCGLNTVNFYVFQKACESPTMDSIKTGIMNDEGTSGLEKSVNMLYCLKNCDCSKIKLI
jgi:hypothetical protein